jgi:hypothetical protein
MATANFRDMSILAQDLTFGNRVASSLWIFCTVAIPGEAVSDATYKIHQSRKAYAQTILNNQNTYKPLFVNVVASNQTVANEATAGGTLAGLTTGAGSQVETAALLCLDADINNAIAASFNSFVPGL